MLFSALTCHSSFVQQKQIVHPAQTICDHLKSINFEGLIYCLATPPFKQLLRDAGFQLYQEVSCPTRFRSSRALYSSVLFCFQREGFVIHNLGDLREAIYGAEPMQAVIIDVDFNLSAAKLMRAQVQLQNENCLFLAGAADALIPFGNGDIIGEFIRN